MISKEAMFEFIDKHKYNIPDGMTLKGFLMLEYDLSSRDAQELIIEYFDELRPQFLSE